LKCQKLIRIRGAALTANPGTQLGRGTGQEPMTKFGSSVAANAAVNSRLSRLRVSREDPRGSQHEISSIQTQGFSIISEADLDRFPKNQGRPGL
jgi:hypothetical protein